MGNYQTEKDMQDFSKGAVIMNEYNMFLCTKDGVNTFWYPSTEDAYFFADNEMAEYFINDWNENHGDCCRLSGVRIEPAPREIELDVCSKEGQDSTDDPSDCAQNHSPQTDYSKWSRDKIIKEILYRYAEDMCDIYNDSTDELRFTLQDLDMMEDDEKENCDDEEDKETYEDWSRDEIINELIARNEDESRFKNVDTDEDSTPKLRKALIMDDEKRQEETIKKYHEIEEKIKEYEDKISYLNDRKEILSNLIRNNI